jgi:hypothetical protein
MDLRKTHTLVIFAITPVPDAVVEEAQTHYHKVEVVALPYDPTATAGPAEQAAEMLQTYSDNGGYGRVFLERALYLPAATPPALVLFLLYVSRGDYGPPYLILESMASSRLFSADDVVRARNGVPPKTQY